jgi:hypothetical protein
MGVAVCKSSPAWKKDAPDQTASAAAQILRSKTAKIVLSQLFAKLSCASDPAGAISAIITVLLQKN